MLFGIHAALASAVSVPEMALTRDESKLLADSVTEVARHYDYAVDPKVMAWIGFFGVVGSLYGPRIAEYRGRVSREKRARDQGQEIMPATQAGGAVMSFPGVSAVQ